MKIDITIARGHANALAKNYRNAYPNSNSHDVKDYVADEMVKFLRAHDARGVDSTIDFWYAEASNY